MADLTEPVESMKPAILSPGLRRGLQWVIGLGVLSVSAVALFAASAMVWNGFILLCGIAIAAFGMLYALAAGEAAGRSMREKAERFKEPGAAGLALEALETLEDPVLVTDRRGAVRWGNAAYRDLAARFSSTGQAQTLPALERIWAASGDGAIYRLARAARQGDVARERLPDLPGVDGQTRYCLEARPSGQEHISWRLMPVFDETSAAGSVPTADWSDQSPVGLFALSAKAELVAANATLRDWLDLAPEDPLPALSDILPKDTVRALEGSRGDEGVCRFDVRLSGRDGIETDAVIALSWDPAKKGGARGVMYGLSATGTPAGVAQAISGATGGRAGRTLDDMFAAAPFGVARLSGSDPATAVIEDANSAMVQMSGGKAKSGAVFANLFDWSGGRNAADVFENAARKGEPAEAVLKTDPPVDIRLVFAPARGGKRAAYMIDVTHWKELEQQLSQGNKMQAVGQLAGGVAHDFNNLLTAIRLNVDELLGRHPVGDPSYGELQVINQTVARAAGLVKKLLAFSRKQTFRMEALDVADVLSDFTVLLRQILEETVKLEIVHGRDVPPIRADKGQLETAIMNLAANARDAMRESGGGTLTIRTSAVTADEVLAAGAPDVEPGEWVQIEVIDEGTGMDEATQQKIFEPFFTTKAVGQGTGLGLATVYGIVKQSGGFLFVDSELGKGSTFRIFLPAHASAEDAAPETVDKPKGEAKPADLAGKGRILLVEDESAVRTIAAKTLAKRGYDVVEAGDGEEALDILADDEDGFDLLVSDVVMPGLDGPGLLEKAAEYLADTRVIFISGYAEEQFSDTLSRDRDISFLPKPFTLTQLAERVKAVLSGDMQNAA
ncbi:ATP-binding protein [Hyphobacterium sp.]|jgi:two-component system cell cycle sensor histidine kinase/response regulator CckA|uniref:ATP-binding protein n=1 Tax=Hyphobacterium sp. TaxID=2004662 RepID=UPI003BAB3B61